MTSFPAALKDYRSLLGRQKMDRSTEDHRPPATGSTFSDDDSEEEAVHSGRASVMFSDIRRIKKGFIEIRTRPMKNTRLEQEQKAQGTPTPILRWVVSNS